MQNLIDFIQLNRYNNNQRAGEITSKGGDLNVGIPDEPQRGVDSVSGTLKHPCKSRVLPILALEEIE